MTNQEITVSPDCMIEASKKLYEMLEFMDRLNIKLTQKIIDRLEQLSQIARSIKSDQDLIRFIDEISNTMCDIVDMDIIGFLDRQSIVINNYYNCTFVNGNYNVTIEDNRQYVYETKSSNLIENGIEWIGDVLSDMVSSLRSIF